MDNAHIHKEAYKPLYRFNSALTIPGPNVEAMIAVCRERLAALPSDATPVQQAAEVMDEVYKALCIRPVPPRFAPPPNRPWLSARAYARIMRT